MDTKPTNTNACTAHDWQPDPWVPGMQVCDCGAERETPEGDADVSTHVVTVTVEQARRAA